MHHDKCYEAAVMMKYCKGTISEYLDFYSWRCLNSSAICAGVT
ncbi:hypothetical protein OESDEN_16735 [Oesophagostomum dentatum]|uniref:Uncharacterized protein n=1 Tax=Oesophagostomum dentatum TaxID=61180 RepID=A0A0B1SK27_OESDE|nr:hypothetical protein OESDEN_16735 [Oesophagostomum dentatum]